MVSINFPKTCLVIPGFLLAACPFLFGIDFRRGDANSDLQIDITDPIHTLFFAFTGGPAPACLDAADADDNGKIELNDAIYSLNFLFLGGADFKDPGSASCGPDPSADTLSCQSYPTCLPGPEDLKRIGHLLNRAAYGPTFEEVERIHQMGIEAWIEEQLNPESIDESTNTRLNQKIEELTEDFVRASDRPLIASGDTWRYFKGNQPPPADWYTAEFVDTGWSSGPSGFGYGDNDDATVLDDMQGNYVSLFIRREFNVSNPSEIKDLVLSIDYDDSFVAYLNGIEVARRNLAGSPGNFPAHTQTASASHEAGSFEDIDISSQKFLLEAGLNVLAVQAHNRALSSSDLTIIPRLLDREVLPGGTTTEIKGIGELKALAQVYAVYSRRQLQSILGEFWENHFTTDYDKVVDYLDDLTNSDASDAMSASQARREASRLEHQEFEFFREHALGSFRDLLLYSAKSPTMAIYLDNVLNVKGNANENYSREILELHAFGADAGYVQKDIEQLAECFTGWGACKTTLENAGDPHGPCGVLVEDTPIVAAGTAGGTWRYFKGTIEPPADWMSPGFVDSTWDQGESGFGYGDGDDNTILTDMKDSYTTIYLRKTFDLPDPSTLKNFILSLDYDDGAIVYLNGTEVARLNVAGDKGIPVPHDGLAKNNHEAGVPVEINLNSQRDLLQAGPNVMAIQGLNAAKGSGDLSIIPILIDREVLPGSVENGDPNGVWTFHFFPERHNSTVPKVLFEDTPYQINIPAGRTGPEGIQDAEEAIDRILDHPSTPIFISAKLIQRFVGDEIDFRNPAEGPYASLLAKCVAAWNTPPRGTIRNVMEEILSSDEFWSEGAQRSKVKTAIEHIASTIRVVGGETNGIAVVDDIEDMGMALFTRNDPDGYAETGFDWIDTNSLLSRMKFAVNLTETSSSSSPGLYWNALSFLDTHGLDTAAEIVETIDNLLFQRTLTGEDRALLTEFLNTDDDYNALPFNRARPDFESRVRRFFGFALSLPQWQFQ